MITIIVLLLLVIAFAVAPDFMRMILKIAVFLGAIALAIATIGGIIAINT